ncbi:fibronectin type III domain-containing protein [Catellatospora sp. KI3]|uniref:fibronectin type III domain-containing protein n=1 Tax=Catellatospora sp. KI3 TaxID=3041620 RepID=UPI002482AEFC|nr:fibronectin type III domain-containing protein [Catellatospora sp. KI3]MDI1460749.1 fibronectin type III domain-containing protein [Catellatospora sp. KI3]
MIKVLLAAALATVPAAPPAPSDQQATALSTSQIRVIWQDNSSNETGFEVSDGVATWTVGANTTRFVNSLLASKAYKCYRVRAYNLVGKSAWTPYTCATTL